MESIGGQAAQERCRARTEEGDRCSRPAGDDGFCYQHDDDDPTVADEGSSGGENGSQADAERDGPETATADGGSAVESAVEPADESTPSGESDESTSSDDSDEPAPESDGSDEAPESDQSSTGSSADEDVPDILDVRRAVQDAAEGVIGRPLDGVLEVSPDAEDGWRVEVEVVERAAVPDTQDILGRYEIEVDDDARVRGYRRLERYRRGDTSPSQPQ